MIDILLINPPQPKPDQTIMKFAPSSPPLSLAYLAASLKNNGYNNISILDFDLKEVNINTLGGIFDKKPPEIVGITTLTNTITTALKLAEIIKQNSPQTKIILGGQHTAFCYEEVLKTDFVDYVAIGESEMSFPQLCHSIEHGCCLEHVKGIAYKKDNEVIVSPPEDIEYPDSIPYPDRTLFDMSKYYDPVSIITSRGCSSRCIFCSASAFRSGKVRFRSAENVLEEIKIVYQSGFRTANFVDDNFMIKKERVVQICEGIKEYFPDLFWTCSARADLISRELIKLMAEANCKGLHFGVETCFSESQKTIRKHLSLEKLEKALELSNRFSISTFCSFIIGLPDEDEQKVRSNINYAIHLHKKYNTFIVFGILTPFPGTELFNEPDRFGITILSDKYSDYDIFTPVIRTKYLDQNQLRSLLFEAQLRYMQNMSVDARNKMQVLSDIVKKFSPCE